MVIFYKNINHDWLEILKTGPLPPWFERHQYKLQGGGGSQGAFFGIKCAIPNICISVCIYIFIIFRNFDLGLIYVTEQLTWQKQRSKVCELLLSVSPDVLQLKRLFRNRSALIKRLKQLDWLCLDLFPSIFPSLVPSSSLLPFFSSSLSLKHETKSFLSHTSIKCIRKIHCGGKGGKSISVYPSAGYGYMDIYLYGYTENQNYGQEMQLQ